MGVPRAGDSTKDAQGVPDRTALLADGRGDSRKAPEEVWPGLAESRTRQGRLATPAAAAAGSGAGLCLRLLVQLHLLQRRRLDCFIRCGAPRPKRCVDSVSARGKRPHYRVERLAQAALNRREEFLPVLLVDSSLRDRGQRELRFLKRCRRRRPRERDHHTLVRRHHLPRGVTRGSVA